VLHAREAREQIEKIERWDNLGKEPPIEELTADLPTVTRPPQLVILEMLAERERRFNEEDQTKLIQRLRRAQRDLLENRKSELQLELGKCPTCGNDF